MANLDVAQRCPRKAFLEETPSGVKKPAQLRSIMKEVLLSTLPQTPFGTVEKEISDLFAQKATTMLPFEAESERKRMTTLIKRYYIWEQKQPTMKILAQDERVKVNFAGASHTVSVHRLIDRGNGQLEAIAYAYKAPETSIRARVNKPSTSSRLLLLQLAGEELAKKLKLNAVTVFGCVYYLKSSQDRSTFFAPEFEDIRSANIASYHFDKMEQADMAKKYATVTAAVNVEAHDTHDCRNCQYDDLCHLEFNKRKLSVVEDKVIKPIDQIHMTPAQRKLVLFDDGICRTDAVAGSGKTTVITLRTLRLLEDGVDPNHILMITFTEKAANEMKERLKAYQSGKTLSGINFSVDQVTINTFNGWGNDLLNQNYKKLGFTDKPQLIDDVQKKDIILEILDHHRGLPLDYRNPFMLSMNSKGCVPVMVGIIDALKAAHAENEDEVKQIVGSKFQGFFAELLAMYNEYNDKLVALNLIDYEDQLRLLLQLEQYGVFRTMEYEHIIVDEFQDSNPNQIDLISRIVKQDPNFKSLVVVGDNMQAIYGFRNASPENLVNFDQIFPNVIDIQLEDNFRSQQPIITMANRILERESAMKKAIIAHRKENGITPVLMNIESVADEIDLYVRQCQKLIRDGAQPSSIAVLCRTRGELIKIQEAMSNAGVPTMLRVSEIIGNAPYVKAVIALAAFFKDPDDMLDLALFAKSLGQDPYNQALLEKSKQVLLDGLANKTTEEEKIGFFFDLCSDAADDYVAADFLEDLRNKSFKTFYNLISYCVKYRDYGTKESHPTKNEEANAVSLITVHSAKGLEWPTVLLSLRRFRLEPEEKRLLYVAVTRAKEKLLITYTEKQNPLIALLKEN